MVVIAPMLSERLRYEPVSLAPLDAFHSLVEDEHVRRYMMDGNLDPRAWSAERIVESQRLFERRGVGLWLVWEEATDELVAFCGFLDVLSIHPEPELVYAMFERFSGRGFAIEMARASIRVLEKLGFERTAVQQGAFGNLLLLRLPAGR